MKRLFVAALLCGISGHAYAERVSLADGYSVDKKTDQLLKNGAPFDNPTTIEIPDPANQDDELLGHFVPAHWNTKMHEAHKEWIVNNDGVLEYWDGWDKVIITYCKEGYEHYDKKACDTEQASRDQSERDDAVRVHNAALAQCNNKPTSLGVLFCRWGMK